MRDSAISGSPLPPSVEKAYHTKCVELKRRLNEIESANDAARLRKRRLDRAIEKMRLERAFLFDRLSKVQQYLPDDSDRETSPPPTPHERQARKPRTLAARSTPPPEGYQSSPAAYVHQYSVPHPAVSTPHGYPPQPPGQTMAGAHAQGRPVIQRTPEHVQVDKRPLSDIPGNEPLPTISWLPSHTNVIMIGNEPKQPPWTVRDIAPRHHLISGFDLMTADEQKDRIEHTGYLPYDIHGNPVLVRQDASGRSFHIFRDDPRWINPVADNIRTDDPWLYRFEMERRPAPPPEPSDVDMNHASPGQVSGHRDSRAEDKNEAGGFTAANRN